MARSFDLGDILSVTTGRLVSRRHIEALYDVLNYMTGDDLFTHQLPRAMQECRPSLLAQHPALADVIVPEWANGVTPEDVFGWLAEQQARFGAQLEVEPVAPADHTRIDPLQELGLMGVPSEKVVVLGPEGSS